MPQTDKGTRGFSFLPDKICQCDLIYPAPEGREETVLGLARGRCLSPGSLLVRK